MTPTDTHLTLLRALPDEAQEKLWAHTPGHMAWITQIDGGGDAIRWILCEKSAGNWLPCDPTAILRVAAEQWPSTCHGSAEHDSAIPEWRFSLDDGSSITEGIGDDPHEAALRLLLAVCGGEE